MAGRRNHGVLTRSKSQSIGQFISVKEDCHHPRFRDAKDDNAMHQLERNDSCRVSKRKGWTQQNVAFRKKKPSLDRLTSFQRMFDEMEIDEDSPFDLCDCCKSSISKVLYGLEKMEESVESCECSDSDDEDDCGNMHCNQISWVEEKPIIPCLTEVQHFSRTLGPDPCYVTNSLTGMSWLPRGSVLRAVHRPYPNLHYWKITATQNGRRAFMFGFESRRGWRYATVKNNNKIRFQHNSVEPHSIDIEQQHLNDNRLFYMEGSSDGAYLIPAARNNYYVLINTDHKRSPIEISTDKRLAHTWQIELA